jgi:hypothetical protein
MSPLTEGLVIDPLRFGNLSGMPYRLQGICGGWHALQKFPVMVMSLTREVSDTRRHVRLIAHRETAHKRKSTVCTRIDLWLVDIDEDSRVA